MSIRKNDGPSSRWPVLVASFVLGCSVCAPMARAVRAEEVCRPDPPACPKPPVHVTWCGAWFKEFDVSRHYEDYCIAKLPRVKETLATPSAALYLRCHCEYQGSIWDRRDP